MGHRQISDDMRADAQRRGHDDLDRDSEGYVPESTLGSALDSYEQMPTDILFDLLDIPSDTTALAAADRIRQFGDDLRRLIDMHRESYPLENLV